jgi:hypothetical protein
MSAHAVVAAIVSRHQRRLAGAAANRPPRVATNGHPYQPGDVVIDPATGKEWQVLHGSRETVLAPASDRPPR